MRFSELHEDQQELVSKLASVLEFLKGRSQDSGLQPNITLDSLIKMVGNTGTQIDPNTIQQLFNEPTIRNLIKNIDGNMVTLNLDGGMTQLQPGGGNMPPEVKVNQMAKRALSRRQ
tara:strand:+ start:442 stop:789 length:348 start_codon:yes stop_codon:yes gene_type:complete